MQDPTRALCFHGARAVAPSSCVDAPGVLGEQNLAPIEKDNPMHSTGQNHRDPPAGDVETFPTLLRTVDSCRWIPVFDSRDGSERGELVCPEDRAAMGYLPAGDAARPLAAPGYVWWYDPRVADALHFYDLVRASTCRNERMPQRTPACCRRSVLAAPSEAPTYCCARMNSSAQAPPPPSRREAGRARACASGKRCRRRAPRGLARRERARLRSRNAGRIFCTPCPGPFSPPRPASLPLAPAAPGCSRARHRAPPQRARAAASRVYGVGPAAGPDVR